MLSNWEVAVMFYLDSQGVVSVSPFVALDAAERSSGSLDCSAGSYHHDGALHIA